MITRSLGQKIRELRIAAGMTQSELGMGILTQSMISHIEKDRYNPSWITLTSIASRLEVPVGSFFTEGILPSTKHEIVSTPHVQKFHSFEESIIDKYTRICNEYNNFANIGTGKTAFVNALFQEKNQHELKRTKEMDKISFLPKIIMGTPTKKSRATAACVDVSSKRIKNLVNKEKVKLQDSDQIPVLKMPVKMKSTSRRTRDDQFGKIICYIYNYQCAVCCTRLRDPSGNPGVQGAHIYPKSLDGSDDIRNGICLCIMHHWAFDAGWFSISDTLNIIVRSDIPATSEYDFIRQFKGKQIHLPQDVFFRPHPVFLQEHRKLKGFE